MAAMVFGVPDLELIQCTEGGIVTFTKVENSNPFFQLPVTSKPLGSPGENLNVQLARKSYLYDIMTESGKTYRFTSVRVVDHQ